MMKSQKGIALIETIVALAIFGIIGVCFLNGLATTSTARATADERAGAKILAESIMEDIKKIGYYSSYSVEPGEYEDEYDGYSSNISVVNMKNGSIQRITITIQHHNHDVFTLEAYKVRRADIN
jgi:type II secretory pathway pseudopilin PulG